MPSSRHHSGPNPFSPHPSVSTAKHLSPPLKNSMVSYVLLASVPGAPRVPVPVLVVVDALLPVATATGRRRPPPEVPTPIFFITNTHTKLRQHAYICIVENPPIRQHPKSDSRRTNRAAGNAYVDTHTRRIGTTHAGQNVCKSQVHEQHSSVRFAVSLTRHRRFAGPP